MPSLLPKFFCLRLFLFLLAAYRRRIWGRGEDRFSPVQIGGFFEGGFLQVYLFAGLILATATLQIFRSTNVPTWRKSGLLVVGDGHG